MVAFLLSLRFVMLVASTGAALGAVLMFWLGATKLIAGIRTSFHGNEASSIAGAVMGATDAFLFGVVLVIFAYAITFAFIVELPQATRKRLPGWMRVEGIGELKRTLVDVIVVYLIVDFATDIAETDRHLDWATLVVPLSIVCIAAAVRLLGMGQAENATAAGELQKPKSA